MLSQASQSRANKVFIMKESQYEMIISWDKADGIFVVDVPELSGCMTHGKTKKQAIANRVGNCSLDTDGARRWDSDSRGSREIYVCITTGRESGQV